MKYRKISLSALNRPLLDINYISIKSSLKCVQIQKIKIIITVLSIGNRKCKYSSCHVVKINQLGLEVGL